MSNPSNQLNLDTGAKLLKYCSDHGHVSIFEHASMTVEIETSRAIAAQILRHRSFCFQEFSQRYADTSELGFTFPKARRQDTKNRQSSHDDLPSTTSQWFDTQMFLLQQQAEQVYKQALELGIAKESARFVLPLNVKTRMYMTGNVRSWVHYIQQRTHESTQLEHRNIAEQIKTIFVEQFPAVSTAMGWKDEP